MERTLPALAVIAAVAIVLYVALGPFSPFWVWVAASFLSALLLKGAWLLWR